MRKLSSMNESNLIESALEETLISTAVEDTRVLLANASKGDETAMAKLVELAKENNQSAALQSAYSIHFKSFFIVIRVFVEAAKSENVLLGLQLLMLITYFDDAKDQSSEVEALGTDKLLEMVEKHLDHESPAIRKLAWQYIFHTIMTTGPSVHLFQSASQPRHLMEILTDSDINTPMKVVAVQILGFAFQSSDSKQSFLSKSLGWMKFAVQTIADYKTSGLLCIMVLQFLNNMAKEPELFFYFIAKDCPLLSPLLIILKHNADDITYEIYQTEALGILMNMALAPENKTRFASPELGFLPLVIDCVRNKTGEMQINALSILWNMAEDTNNQTLFASSELSLLLLLISLIKERTGEVKAKALGILSNMAYNDTNHILFTSSELDLMSLIVSVVKEDTGAARLNALGILWNMASNPEVNHKIFAKPSLGLIPALNQVLVDGEDTIRINALGVIWNMASNPRNKSLLTKQEFALLPQLSNLIAIYSDDQRMNALGALWSLSENTANQKLFSSNSVVLPAVMHVMKTEKQDHEVIFKTLGILNNLAIEHSCQIHLMSPEYELHVIVTNYCFEESSPPKSRVKALILLSKLAANVSFRPVFTDPSLDLVNRLTNLFADLETVNLGLASSAMLLLAKLASVEAVADLLLSENSVPFVRLMLVLKDGNDAIRYYCLQVLLELSLVRPAAMRTHPMDIINELIVQIDKFEDMTVDNSRNVPQASMILLNLSKENQYKLMINDTSFDMLQRCRDALTKTVTEFLSVESSDRTGLKVYLLGILFSWTEGIKRHIQVVLALTDPDLGLLSLLKSALEVDDLKSIASSFLWNLAEDGNSDVAQRFVDQDIHAVAVQMILNDRPTSDTSPTTTMSTEYVEEDNDSGDKVYVSLLNMLMNLSRHWAVRETLKAAGLADLALSIYNSTRANRDSVKAMIILLLLFGNEERESAERAGRHFVIGDEQIAQLLKILSLTLQSQGGEDFPLGTFCLSVLLHVCVVLAQSDSNKGILVQEGAIPLIMDALSRFQYNQAEIYLCGGGGDDEQVADLCIEALTQIAFDFETDKSLQRAFLSTSHDVTELVRGVSYNHKLNSDARTKAGLLYERLVATDDKQSICSIESSDCASASSSVGTLLTPTTNDVCDDDIHQARVSAQHHRPRHIMLSYCWHSSANTNHVKSLANELRQLGHDVWRDEDGSTIVPPMSGSVDDRMAEAIENSETVVICVSAAYKLSSNCRLEAQYANALAKRRKLKLIFVMLNEHYTTVSSPNYCDGWLGIMVGSHLWQPMWREEMISAVARAIAGQVHECTKIAVTSILREESNQTVSQTVVSRSVMMQRENTNFSNMVFADDRLTVSNHELSAKTVLLASEAAWGVLTSINKVANQEQLQLYLDEIGVDSAEDLEFCRESMLQQMAEYLKPVGKNKFLYYAKKIDKKQAHSLQNR